MFGRLAVACATALLGLSLLGPHAARAEDGTLRFEKAWMRPALGPNSAAYMDIVNTGTADDRLLSARLEGAGTVELHDMIMDGTVMRMRPIEGGLIIPAGGTVSLSPGGKHLMLLGLTRPYADADAAEIVLAFEHAGELRVPLRVSMTPPADAPAPAAAADGADHSAHGTSGAPAADPHMGH